MKSSKRDDTPVLITEAAPSLDDQHNARRRKYAILMSLRIPCLILAGLTWQMPWLALFFLVISVPLPWIAVLIANDRPAKKSLRPSWFNRQSRTRALEQRDHPVIDN